MFYDAQLIVYNKMESSFYADFVVSHDYTQFVCQSESAMDEIRKQLNVNEVEEQLPDLDWSDGLNFKERVRKGVELFFKYFISFYSKIKKGLKNDR